MLEMCGGGEDDRRAPVEPLPSLELPHVGPVLVLVFLVLVVQGIRLLLLLKFVLLLVLALAVLVLLRLALLARRRRRRAARGGRPAEERGAPAAPAVGGVWLCRGGGRGCLLLLLLGRLGRGGEGRQGRLPGLPCRAAVPGVRQHVQLQSRRAWRNRHVDWRRWSPLGVMSEAT